MTGSLMNATNLENGNAVAEYNESDALQRHYLHGATYVDERAVLLEGDVPDASGEVIDKCYYLLQELYTVTGLMKKNGTLAEAYVYDAYGKPHLWGYRDFDFNRDGDVDEAYGGRKCRAYFIDAARNSAEKTHP